MASSGQLSASSVRLLADLDGGSQSVAGGWQLEAGRSQIERLELVEHVADTGADSVALVPQRRQLGRHRSLRPAPASRRARATAAGFLRPRAPGPPSCDRPSPTSSFTFSSRRSIGSSSTLRRRYFRHMSDPRMFNLAAGSATAVTISELPRAPARARPESRRRSSAPPRRSACDPAPETSAAPTGSPSPPGCPCPDSDRRTSTPTSGAGVVRAGRLNGATNDLRRQDVRDDDRQIADDERMPRQDRVGLGRRSTRIARQSVEIQLGDEHRSCRGQSAGVGDARQTAGRGRRAVAPSSASTRRRLAGHQKRLAGRFESRRRRQARRTAARRRP